MGNALALLVQQGLSRQTVSQMGTLCRDCYDDDPLLCGLVLAFVIALGNLWEGDQGIPWEDDQRLQALQQPLLVLLRTPRTDTAEWIAQLGTVFRAWKPLGIPNQ